ncbi:MAG: glycosyl hydrolase, partial [bacterium]
LLVFKRIITESSPWFNGDSYGDNLNPDSVKKFIETTYEKYKEEIGDEFGKAVPGIFTDEPNVYSHHQPDMRGVPWTDIVPEYFNEKRGYDLLPFLPYLFFDGEKSKKTRHDFWWTVSDLFAEAYSKQIGDWCKDNNLAFTGHFLLEDKFADAVRTTGSTMVNYQYMDVPGIDILTESISENLTVKQCSSVANQFGRKRVLSELYGCTGWEFTFEGQKWVGDWQYALGVNYRCQHLALYSLEGCRKRDYPPSFNYNNTWWKYNNIVEDYFGRLSAVLVSGEPVQDILVLHPISTAWANFNGQNMEAVNKIGEDYGEFIEILLAQHRDFDLGDETILAEHGKVKKDNFVVNKASYKVVVIPPMETIRQSTVDLLEKFINNGGKVIACKPLPYLIEGEENNKLEKLFDKKIKLIEDIYKLEEAAAKLHTRQISIKDKSGSEDDNFIYLQRTLSDQEVYFIVNTDKDSSHKVTIDINSEGKLEKWDPLSGEIETIFPKIAENKIRFEEEIEKVGSRLYVLKKDSENKQLELDKNKAEYKLKKSKFIGPACSFKRTEPNVLTLDYCNYQAGESEKWSEKMQVWKAQKKIRESLDMREIYLNGIEQRWRWVSKKHKNDGYPVKFKYNFNVEDIPENPIYFVVENAEDFTITFNGEEINNSPSGWFLDKSFDKIELPETAAGENTLILSCEYENRMEIEECYLIGDFAVDTNREIVSEPEKLQFSDWCLQGYYHYAGSIIYSETLDFALAEIEQVRLHLRDYSAITVKIVVNDQTAGHIPWALADGLNITNYLKNGANKIEIEVMGSLRNMLGPLHQKSGRLSWTRDSSFRRIGDNYTADYVLQPYGLFETV